MADVEFFFDPVCPWAWITSRGWRRWPSQRHLDVDWRFIALRIVNEDKDYEKDFSKGYVAAHGTGLKLLRVVRGGAGRGGPAAPSATSTPASATDLHVEDRGQEIRAAWEQGFPDYLRSAGVAEKYLPAANDEAWDDVLREDTNEALSRVGKDVGTPILTFAGEDGTRQSFFGPVINRVPARRGGGPAVGRHGHRGQLPRPLRAEAVAAGHAADRLLSAAGAPLVPLGAAPYAPSCVRRRPRLPHGLRRDRRGRSDRVPPRQPDLVVPVAQRHAPPRGPGPAASPPT